ncbi:hypothetical protein [Actinoplanes sp. NPDC051494]|uniref:hypothetical protein n=1 Tax=Actinoplanes sp. NPDC051494 TaxID=3363907 RepID=UPI0037B107A0
MGALWVAGIHLSARVAEKINSKHGIASAEVHDAIVCVEGLEYVHSHHELRGWRWLVKVEIQGRPVLVVLYDSDDAMGDIYRVGSAYFIDR